MREPGLFERLESRHLLSAEMVGTELVITGTNGADDITVAPGVSNGVVTVTGVEGVTDGTAFDGVDSVRVKLLQGNDRGEITGLLKDTSGNAMIVRMFGAKGWDTLIGNANPERLRGGAGQDWINGKGGDDRLFGGFQQDTIFGANGDDLILGNAGRDNLFGGNGNDAIYGGVGNDRIFGGNDNDVLKGQLGFDQLFGLAGNDALFGGGQGDMLRGGIGNDALAGGWGNDDLFGGFGADTMSGGLGQDSFRGPLSERSDFGAGDAFFNAALSDQSIGELGEQFWAQIDSLDAEFVLTSDMWIVINGSQTLLAECGPHLQAAERAFDSLTEFELQQIAIQALPIMEDFFELVGDNFSFDSTGDVLGLLNQFIAILPNDVRVPVNQVFDCMTSNQELLDQMADAINRIEADGEVPPVLMEGYGTVAMGAFGM